MTSFSTTDPMTQPRRDIWLRRTTNNLAKVMNDKFKLGRIQHSGDIGEKTVLYLVQQMEEEAIDQLMYVRELKRRITNDTNQSSL